MKLIGSNDSSVDKIEEDLFEVSQYVNGLSDFIKSCVTPMTISIQGDWGSGKTSMMNMVRESLGDDLISVWFNTWQYSQFNMGEDLAISFLGKLIKSLQPDDGNKTINETFKKAYSAIKKAGLITVDHFVGGAAATELEQLAEKFAKGEDDAVDAINNLKEEFQESVKKKLAEKGKNRLVVFIDDLDRLNPGKAVELLEVLKIFLDCDNCVFVLAIDYSVVSQGVKEKYGDLIGDDKGKSFFDKIIQVPFKMPVAHYKVDNFIVEMFRQINIDLTTEGDANIYVNLIQASVGCNPRTMKRLFNAYLLLTCISNNVEVASYLNDRKLGFWYKKMLFGILCCQHAYEDMYNFLVKHHDEFQDSNLLMCLQKAETYKADSSSEEEFEEKLDNALLVEAFQNKSDDYIRRLAFFMEKFVKVIDKDGSATLDDEELKGFTELLNLTTITSAGNDTEIDAETPEKRHRRLTRTILMPVVKNINEIVAKNDRNKTHPLYQSNEDSKDGSYKSYWADGWQDIYIDGKGMIDLEYTLMSNVDDETVQLRIWTKRRQSFKKGDYEAYFAGHELVKNEEFIWDGKGISRLIDLGTLPSDDEEIKALSQRIEDIVRNYLELI